MLDDTPSPSTPSPSAPKPQFIRQLGVSGSPEKEAPAAAAGPEEEKKRAPCYASNPHSYDVESTTDCSEQEEGDDDKGYSEEMEYGTAEEQWEPNVWESESVEEDKVWHEAERRYAQAKEDEDMEERVVSPPTSTTTTMSTTTTTTTTTHHDVQKC